MAQKSCGVLPTQGSRTFSAGRKNVRYSAPKPRAVPPRVQNGWKPAPTRSKPKHSDLPTDRVPVRPPSLPDHGPLFETAAAVPGPKLKLEEKRGDLFTCPESASLAHCVSRDLSMSKGVAVAFKEKFKGVSSLKEQDARVGGVAVLQRNSRFIYYLVTKERCFHKPTYDSLSQSLQCLLAHVQCHNVTHLCIPRIGCGLDRLQWVTVETMIREIFRDVDMTITVYSL